MDTALPEKFPFILDRNLAKANCTENHVCTSCDNVVLDPRTFEVSAVFRICQMMSTTITLIQSMSYLLNCMLLNSTRKKEMFLQLKWSDTDNSEIPLKLSVIYHNRSRQRKRKYIKGKHSSELIHEQNTRNIFLIYIFISNHLIIIMFYFVIKVPFYFNEADIKEL